MRKAKAKQEKRGFFGPFAYNFTCLRRNCMPHFTISRTFLFNPFELSEKDKDVFDKYLSVLESSGIAALLEGELACSGPKRERPPYDPCKLFAVIAYAFSKHSGSLRKIEESIRYDLRFIYLMEGGIPSYVTISKFLNNIIVKHRSGIFAKITSAIIERYKIDTSDCFIDGTKLEANANKYKFVWRPTAAHARLNERARELLSQYFEGVPEPKGMTSLKIANYLSGLGAMIAERGLKAEMPGKGHRAERIVKDYNALSRYLIKALEYEEREETCGPGRNSYFKTDVDATAMCLKEDYYSGLGSDMHAAYNVQIIVSKGLVLDYYVSQDRNDTRAFKPALEKMLGDYGDLPKRLCADSGYGSLGNYLYLKEKGIGNYVKYVSWQSEVSGKAQRLFKFDGESLVCLAGKSAKPSAELRGRHPKRKGDRFYVIDGCKGCRRKSVCFALIKDKKATSRVFETSPVLTAFKDEAMSNLLSPKGIEMRVNRSAQAEGAFGVIKQDMDYERVRRRGLEKVDLELMMTLLGYNIRKLFRLISGKAKLDYWIAPENLQPEKLRKPSGKAPRKRKKGANEALRTSYKRKKRR